MAHPNQVPPTWGGGYRGRSREFNAYILRQSPERRRELLNLEHAYAQKLAQDNDPGPGVLEETMRGYEDAPAGTRPTTPDI
jgi:hypothetical protein